MNPMTQLVPSSEDTRIYEIALLYPYPMVQKEESQLLKDIARLLEEAGAKEVSRDVWGRRGLAYPIKGSTEATVLILYVDMEPGKLKEFDQQLKILKGMLRHLIVKPPKHYQMVSYAKAFTEWQAFKATAGERAAREKEEQLKQKVLEKAKRQTKRTETRTATKKADAPAAPMKGEALDAQLDKLISDDDLNL